MSMSRPRARLRSGTPSARQSLSLICLVACCPLRRCSRSSWLGPPWHLASKPKVLLLDEPLSNLDANLPISLPLELKRVQLELNFTARYVAHDQGEAFALSDRIAVLRDGKVMQVGSPQELYGTPRDSYLAGLLGINVFEGRVIAGGSAPVVEAPFGIVDSRTPQSGGVGGTLTTGQRVNCLVRPEDVLVEPASGAPADGRLSGEVIASDLVGGHRDCEVRLSLSWLMRGWAAATAALRPGDSAEVWFRPQSVVVMGVESQPHQAMKTIENGGRHEGCFLGKLP